MVQGMNELLDLAERQGFVTARQASRMGLPPYALTRLVSDGRLARGVRSTYLVPDGTRTLEQTHALLTRAVLDNDPFSVASHHSALALLDVPLFGVPFDVIHLADARKSTRIRESVHRHVLRTDDVVGEAQGCRILDPALSASLLAARFGVEAGLVSMDALLRTGTCAPEALLAVVEGGRIRRGLVRARTAVQLADGRAESPGESRLRLIVSGSPWRYDLQVQIGEYRVDLLLEKRLILEYDGRGKYQSGDDLFKEKLREDWLRSRGYGFLRVVGAHLGYPVTLRSRIADELRRTAPRPAA